MVSARARSEFSRTVRHRMNERSLSIGEDGGGPIFEVGAECHRVKQPKLCLDMWRDAHNVLDVELRFGGQSVQFPLALFQSILAYLINLNRLNILLIDSC